LPQGQTEAVPTPRAVAQTTARARRIVPLGILSTGFALIVAISTWVHLDIATLRVGANINHALALVLLSAPLALVLPLLLRRRLRFLAFVLLGEAASLGAAIVLVALDSATYAGIGYDPLRFVGPPISRSSITSGSFMCSGVHHCSPSSSSQGAPCRHTPAKRRSTGRGRTGRSTVGIRLERDSGALPTRVNRRSLSRG
jgi:hypothetical protein